jgi:hypothetical protein
VQGKMPGDYQLMGYFTRLLQPLALACTDLSYDSQNHLDLVTSYLVIIYCLSPADWKGWIDTLEELQQKPKFLQITFSTLWKLLNGTYPPHWNTMLVISSELI